MAEQAGIMPIGNPMTEIREKQVEVVKGNAAAPIFEDDAAATLVWENYNQARNYVENNAWLLEWQETDVLYQSPIPNRFQRVENGRPARVPEFLVAKMARTMARAVKRGLFAEQYPFFLRPTGKTSQAQVDAWTELLGKLLKRMNFKYQGGLQINCQTLQGTGIGKFGWDEKTVTKKIRKRKTPPVKVQLPMGQVEVPTQESDEFITEDVETVESWPFFEYRRLGTTQFDPKWCTPDKPDESAGYVIDIDYVNFSDLQEMRQLECYKNIPDEETLKRFFFDSGVSAAPAGSTVEDTMTSKGSMVTHADARNQQTDMDPLAQPLMLIEQWDTRTVKTILVYEGRKLTIRNEEHGCESSTHVTATWWPIDNCGYGIGIGRLNGPDQRVKQGVKNECLKMIAYPFNAPLVYTDPQDAPTQNVINRMGGFWNIRGAGPGGDYRKAVGFLQMPEIPADAWRMLDAVQKGAEDLSGANAPFQQGALGGPGSSAARTATGASRIAGMSDQNVADPIDSFADGVIIPTVEFLVRMVKLKMPLQEIRDILSTKHAAVIEEAVALDQFLNASFEVDVLAGQKLAAKQGIQQLIPLFLQIVQQPQLMEYLHQRGQTIDFGVMVDLMMQVSELTQQPDIIRDLTDDEKKQIQQMNPGIQKVQGELAKEKMKGENQKEAIQTKGQVDLGVKAAETVMEHASNGIPLARAAGLNERADDEQILKNGLPDLMQQ